MVVVDEEEEIEGGLIDLEKEIEDEDDSKRYLENGEWSRVYEEEDNKAYNGKSEDEEGDEEEEDETEKEEEEEAEMSDSNDDIEEDE
ncbi:hypothetical protein O181_066230 [Austropuccinia psidii MF-1]|uniref:Uncharacterized protein n=1 Tax=Austropuccinia psidii MF-1 TaxID=1389203 RepID=A0A9Q3ENL9_9BASI|nr:hypothetical protein [Austropuccinia psidii MF-1]